MFTSFALHLFSPEDELRILSKFLAIAKEAVIIIDHEKTWRFATACMEWLEGSYYDQFIRLDFAAMIRKIGSPTLEESEISHCSVMCFHP